MPTAVPRDARGVNLYPTGRAADNLKRLRRQWAHQVAHAVGDDRTTAVALLERMEAVLVAERIK